jgi:excisionase family DNA binding protein
MHLERNAVLTAPADGPAGGPQGLPRPPRFLSVAAAALLLDLSQVTLYRAIHSREFPAIKVRGRYVIPSKAIDAMEEAAVQRGAVVDAADWAEGPDGSTLNGFGGRSGRVIDGRS